jgi:hypothetical protein
MSDEDLAAVLDVDLDALRLQIPRMRGFLVKFGDDLPDEISAQLDALKGRAGGSLTDFWRSIAGAVDAKHGARCAAQRKARPRRDCVTDDTPVILRR